MKPEEIQFNLNDWKSNTKEFIEKTLQKFQDGLVTAQVRQNLVWNGVNAVLRALYNKGLITNEEVKEAGEQLYREAQENLKKAAAEEIVKNYTPTPLDTIKTLIYPSKK